MTATDTSFWEWERIFGKRAARRWTEGFLRQPRFDQVKELGQHVAETDASICQLRGVPAEEGRTMTGIWGEILIQRQDDRRGDAQTGSGDSDVDKGGSDAGIDLWGLRL